MVEKFGPGAEIRCVQCVECTVWLPVRVGKEKFEVLDQIAKVSIRVVKARRNFGSWTEKRMSQCG